MADPALLDLQDCPCCGSDPDYTDPSWQIIHIFCGNLRCVERPRIRTSRGALIAARLWNAVR